jgi:hypothetical protein
MPFILRLATLAVALVLGACATAGDVMRERVEKIPEAERSYMIGVFAVECVPDGADCGQTFNQISLHYRGVGNDMWGLLHSTQGSLFGNNTVYDFTRPEAKEKGFYFCDGLPAGTWMFDSYDFYNFANGGGGYSMKDEAKFNLPFTVKPGEVVYLGKLKVTLAHGKNVFHMNVTAPGDVVLSSDPEHEIAAAMAKCPASVQSRTVQPNVLKAAMAHGHPLVRDASESP